MCYNAMVDVGKGVKKLTRVYFARERKKGDAAYRGVWVRIEPEDEELFHALNWGTSRFRIWEVRTDAEKKEYVTAEELPSV